MDEFYLPEDIVEWLGLKKSEYLARLIGNSLPDDIQFEEYMDFEHLVPNTLATPDWTSDHMEDGHKVKTFVKSYSEKGAFQQVIVGTLVPDQEKQEVFIPILVFATRMETMVHLFGKMPFSNRH